jgi:hypothetical protein
MEYLVDFAIKVMTDISSSKIQYFQRDGNLFIASEEGFAQLSLGLKTIPEQFQQWEQRTQDPEIQESKDAIQKWVGDKYNQKPQFHKKDQPYIEAIAFGPDDYTFTLEEIAKTAKNLGKLPDDGKIRMVTHASGYHSHKYGYAADGIDVWLNAARVMEREKYLDIARKKEESLINAFLKLSIPQGDRDLERAYHSYPLPNCTIMTPNTLVGIPRSGYFDYDRDRSGHWTNSTRLKQNYDEHNLGNILQLSRASSYEESPYGYFLQLNSHILTAKDIPSFKSEAATKIERLNTEVKVITDTLQSINPIVVRLNTKHNELCQKEIDWRKEMKQGRFSGGGGGMTMMQNC